MLQIQTLKTEVMMNSCKSPTKVSNNRRRHTTLHFIGIVETGGVHHDRLLCISGCDDVISIDLDNSLTHTTDVDPSVSYTVTGDHTYVREFVIMRSFVVYTVLV